MTRRDYQNIIAGLSLILIGGFIATHAMVKLPLGIISNMGPGMFPAALGVIMIVVGLLILIPALFVGGEPMSRPDLRSFLAISVAIGTFGLMLVPFGLIPAIVAQTIVAGMADRKLSWLGLGALAAVLSAGSYLIFKVGLGVPVAAFDWRAFR